MKQKITSVNTSTILSRSQTVVLAVLIAGYSLTSCNDEWDRHYFGEGMDSAADAPSLWYQISTNSSLGEFTRVLSHVGYDKVLDSPQSFSVWAPMLTSSQADSVIALYDQQKQSTITMPDGMVRRIQDKDNKAVIQFVQNHIALYGRSVSSAYTDTIQMMNGKNMILTSTDINSVPFVEKNIVACNGILYILASPQSFEPNVREAIGLEPGVLDNANRFFSLFDKYMLDEKSSVQRNVVDGKIVYADSVLTRNNELYPTLGWIEREDSDYIFVAPSDEVWNREYKEYVNYFKYDDMVENRDSLSHLNAQFAVIRGRLFNRRIQKNDYQDSLTNTLYLDSPNYYGLNVFMNPRTTLLSGLTPWKCSNGEVYIDTEGRIDPKSTFLEDRYLMASNSSARKTPLLLVNNEKTEAVSIKTRSVRDSLVVTLEDSTKKIVRFPELKEQNYIEIAPQTFTNVSNRNSSIYFYLPKTFSSLYYNVYLVMVPPRVDSESSYQKSDALPTRFQVYYNERLQTPRTTLTSDPNDDIYFAPPSEDRALSVPAGETHSSGNQYFLTSGDKIDFICIDKARQPKFSSYNMFGAENPIMRYRITTSVRQSDLTNGVQTNVMRINRLIYIGFKTAEEAKAYEFDLSNLKEFNVSL
ncbi:MAG: hypothetical protein J6T94_08430 [Bacteroidaceae bacterium]|nr:hypothetical protein [Bacteroidaceae bacterium]